MIYFTFVVFQIFLDAIFSQLEFYCRRFNYDVAFRINIDFIKFLAAVSLAPLLGVVK
jgi:hypothetical protein